MKRLLILLLSICTIGTASAATGLSYSYYEGNWSTLPNFSSLTPAKQGVGYPNIDPRKREMQYAFLWQGYINIPTTGTYKFETYSDDGSKLLIGDNSNNLTLVVDNDGLHGNQTRSGSIYLNAGQHQITMAYFQGGGDQTWQVLWSSNVGLSRTAIPDNAFSSDAGAVATPGNPGIYYSYYEGNWQSMPNFSSLTAVKSGVSPNALLDPRNRESNYAFLWQGYIMVPATGTYTFETNSDDGSKLLIGDNSGNLTLVVDNDGLHGSQIRTGSIYLNAGPHQITMAYFQGNGSQIWEVLWSSNVGLSRTKISDNVLTTSSTGTGSGGTGSGGTGSGGSGSGGSGSGGTGSGGTGEVAGSGGLTGNRNYYFSAVSGDDNRSSADAQNPNTPWRTLNKLNQVFSGLNGGDAVLFKRGELFDGNINITKSGSSNNPIIFSSFGTGLKPVINGLYTLSNWQSVGNNIWEAYCPGGNYINMVTLNGVPKAMGRYPNATDANKGYLTLDAHDYTRAITDYQLSGYPNWQGAEVVIRKNNWVLDRCLVTYHSGNTLYYNSPTGHEPTNGYGFFIQNSPQTLDQHGEWYYDPSQQKLRMYLVNNPTQNDIKASTNNALVAINNKSDVLFDNLTFQGADEDGVKIENNSNNVRIQNCNFVNSGLQAVRGTYSANIVVENTNINNSSNTGIDMDWCSYSTFKNNVIKNSGMMAGMGKSNNQNYDGISIVDGKSIVVEGNEVDSSGYCGITFTGESMTIKNNFVNYFTLVKDDGGGIYSWGDLYRYNRIVTGNIVMNGIGSIEGTIYTTSTGSSGILFDDASANVDITNNSIANCSRAGIYLHNSRNMNLNGNTFYNNRTQVSMVHDEIDDVQIRNMQMSNNIVFSKTATQFVVTCETLGDDISSFGSFNSNYYARPIDPSGINQYKFKDGGGQNHYTYYDLQGWRARFGFDQNSAPSPVNIPAYIVNYKVGGNRYSNGSFNNNISGVFCSSGPGSCSTSWSNGKLDGGAVQVNFNGNGYVNDVLTFLDFGAVEAGKTYLISFSLIGNQSNKTINSFILENGGSYSHLNETMYFTLQNYRTEVQFLFKSPITTNNAMIALGINGPDAPFWFDNFSVVEANVSATNPDDYLRFEYNPSDANKTVYLNGSYVDVKNNSYSNNLTLAPHSSIVLIKQTANSVNQAAATSKVNEAAVNETANAATDNAVLEAAAVNMRITPNPATDKVQLFVTGLTGTKKANLSVRSISGATLKTVSLDAMKQNVTFDVSSWSNGVYLVTITYDNGVVINNKFIKN